MSTLQILGANRLTPEATLLDHSLVSENGQIASISSASSELDALALNARGFTVIKDLAVTSEGTRVKNPQPLKKAQAKLKRLQRELSRRKKGGQNREKTRKKVAQAQQSIANIRRDTRHKATAAMVAKTKPDSERPSVVVLEDLNVSGMLANHCLAQALSAVGFAEFRTQLEYKTVGCGSALMVADSWFPSSRLCRHCGAINSELKLSDREWTCACGAVHDRALNAAINLKTLAVRGVPPKQTCVEQVNVYGDGKLQPSGSVHHGNRNQTSDLSLVDSSRF